MKQYSNQVDLTGRERADLEQRIADGKFPCRVVRLAKCRAGGCENTVIDPQFDNQLCTQCEDELAAWQAPIDNLLNQERTAQ